VIELQLIALLATTLAVLFILVIMKNVSSQGWLFLFYPPTFLVLFFTVLFLAPMVPVLALSESAIYRYSPDGYEAKSWLLALVFATLFILATAFVAARIVSFEGFRNRIRSSIARMDRTTEKRVDLLYLLIFYLLPLISLIYLLNRFGGVGYEDYMVNRTIERRGLGYLIMPSTWLTISISTLLVSALIGRKALSSLIYALPLTAFFIWANLFLGSKSRGLIVLVLAVLAWALYRTAKNRFDLRVVAVVPSFAILVSVVGLFFGDIRESVSRGVELNAVNTRVSLAAAFSKFNAFGAVENTVWLVENVGFDEIIGGRSFVAVLAAPVPRNLWPDKPVGGGPELRNLIHPGSYDIIGGRNLTSYSPGIIAESYMNFWIFGLFVGPLLFGALIGGVTFLAGRINSSLTFVVFVILVYRTVYMMTGEVFGSMVGIGTTLLPVMLLFGLRSLLNRSALVPLLRAAPRT
jgi:hypothetical protein